MPTLIDAPGNNTVVDPKRFTVRGWLWLESDHAQIEAVEAWHGETLLGETTVLLDRIDVRAALSLAPETRNGFEFSASHPGIQPGAVFSIDVRVRLRLGARTPSLARIEVEAYAPKTSAPGSSDQLATPHFQLAACLAFRNAGRYLREWLLFHLAVGFDRFYLYNNDSDDDFARVLAPFLKLSGPAGPLIELIDWTGTMQQHAIYDDCLLRARGQTRWLAFIDDDEFLFPVSQQSLLEVLPSFEAFAGVAVCWRLYGSSGSIHYDDDWVIRRFNRCAPGTDQHVKCIVQPARVSKALVSAHLFATQPGFSVVDEKLRPIDTMFAPCPSADLLRINHYLIKSMEELAIRRTSREIDVGNRNKLSLVEWIRLDRGWNAVEDNAALRFETRMKEIAAELDLP